MALIPSALTTVEMAKAHLNIPSADTTQTARVELLINAATGRLETMTDRLLKSRQVTEIRSGRKSSLIQLQQWPVTSVYSLKIDDLGQFPSTSLVNANDYAIADGGDGLRMINDVFPNGQGNIEVIYTAGYDATSHAANLAELELACLWLVEWFYRHRERQDMGRTSKSKGDETVGILAQMPEMIREIVMDYQRLEMPLHDRPIANL